MKFTLFELPASFWAEYVNRRPAWGPLGELTYRRTYSRSIEGLYDRHSSIAQTYGLTSEEWWLTVLRVVEGTYGWQRAWCLENGRPWSEERALYSAKVMYDLIFNFKFLPPGRGLWSMGTPLLERSGAAANNCGYITTRLGNLEDNASWVMNMLMLGVGVGFDASAYLIGSDYHHSPVLEPLHTVEDTREGWCKALRLAIRARRACRRPPLFDLSKIRPAGVPLRTMGGTSSGPEPLRELLAAVDSMPMGPGFTVDVMNSVGRCVVAGNIRRSAQICLGPSENWFLKLKDYEVNPARATFGWASNNSVHAYVGDDYSAIAKSIKGGGEPGLFWEDNAADYHRMRLKKSTDTRDRDVGWIGTNPCSEQTLHSEELCCLVETFPANHENYYDFQRTLKYAYLYAKTVTFIPTGFPRTDEIIAANRRIGCSQSGIVQAIAKFGKADYFENFCDRGYNFLRSLDDRYSEWLDVNTSVKITSVKPSGTVSLLCGATPGMHYPHSTHYLRRIRLATNSALLPALRSAGYRCVDLDNEPNTTAVEVPVRENLVGRGKAEVLPWEQVELAAQLQTHWADNQVSVTVTFNESEGSQIKPILESYDRRLKSVSFLPNAHGYANAPYEEISPEEYEKRSTNLKAVDFAQAGHDQDDSYCSGDKCLI